MNTGKGENRLKDLFKQLPEDALPVDFRTTLMQRIVKENIRIKKRSDRWTLFSIIVASLCMIGLAVLCFLYLEIPLLSWSWPSTTLSPFYLYIGALALLLLGGDYLMRKRYREKHKKE